MARDPHSCKNCHITYRDLKVAFLAPAQSINPPTDGVILTFRDKDGVIIERAFPPGAGWKTSTGLKWTFKEHPVEATLKIQFNAEQGTFVVRAKVKDLGIGEQRNRKLA